MTHIQREIYTDSLKQLHKLNQPETLPLWEIMGVPLD